jgi:hypothetical protein
VAAGSCYGDGLLFVLFLRSLTIELPRVAAIWGAPSTCKPGSICLIRSCHAKPVVPVNDKTSIVTTSGGATVIENGAV